MAFKVFTDVVFISRYPSGILDITYSKTRPKQVISRAFRFRKYDLIILNGIRVTTYLFLLFKLFGVIKGKIIVLDPIFVKPGGRVQGILSRIKGFLLNRADALYIYARNNTGVEKHFGVSREKFVYVPFKVNGLDLIRNKYSDRKSRGYIFSGGRSRRDYATFIAAAAQLPDIPFRIVCPKRDELLREDCLIYAGKPPDNVEIINDNGTLDEFFEVMSESEIVVLPTTPDNIAPAGISVYLNAMALKRPLIISEGPAVDDILTEDQAIIVKIADIDALRDSIKQLYYDENRKKSLAENAYTYALSLGDERDLFYSIEQSAAKLLQ